MRKKASGAKVSGVTAELMKKTDNFENIAAGDTIALTMWSGLYAACEI